MKNFKKVVFGLLAMLVMVTGVNAEKTDYNIQSEGVMEACTESPDEYVRCTVTKAFSYTYGIDVKSKDAVLTISDGVDFHANGITVAKDAKLVIRVEGNGSLTLDTSTIKVAAGGSLVIDYGRVTMGAATTPLITVEGDPNATTNNLHGTSYTALSTSVVVNSGAILTSSYEGLRITKGYVTATLDGDWEVKNAIIRVQDGNSDVTVAGGKYVSTAAEAILVNAGTATITVNGGTITSVSGANIAAGTLVVNNGTMDVSTTAISRSTNAINVTGNGSLTINNGEFKADQFAVSFGSTGNLVIADGKFVSLNPKYQRALYVSAKGADSLITGGEYTGDANTEPTLRPLLGEGLKAVRIGDTVYVGKEHKLDIEVVEENGKKIELHTPQNFLGGHTYTLKYLEDNRYLLVEANEGYVAKYVLVVGDEQTLVKDGEFTMPDSDAKLVVTFVTPDELNQEMDNPTNGGENDGGKGDEETNTNPGTFDGIATIVTMAVSSLSAAGYSIKKIVRK